MYAKSLQSYPTLCDPMDCSPPGSSVHGILQARIWSGLPCPPPGIFPTQGSNPFLFMPPALAGRFFTTSTTWEALKLNLHLVNGSFSCYPSIRSEDMVHSCGSWTLKNKVHLHWKSSRSPTLSTILWHSNLSCLPAHLILPPIHWITHCISLLRLSSQNITGWVA